MTPYSSIFLATTALFVLGQGVSGTVDHPEAQEAINRLEFYMNYMDNEFNKIGNYLVNHNYLELVLLRYRRAYGNSEGTTCVGDEPPDQSGDDNLMMSYMQNCDEKVSSPELYGLINKINARKDKVASLDNELQTIAENCGSSISPTCNKERTRILDNLANIPSKKEKADFAYLVESAIQIAEGKLRVCFKQNYQDLYNKLKESADELEKCLSDNSY